MRRADFSEQLPLLFRTDVGDRIDLSRNESFLTRQIESTCMEANRYCDVEYLRNQIAELEGVMPDQIILGNGSTEILAIAAKVGATISRKAQVARNSYGPIRNLIRMADCIPVEEAHHVRFIVNPDNPTGQRQYPGYHLTQKYSLLVIDEAYVGFDEDVVSFKDSLGFSLNWIITRTFSKLHGLPSIRVGYGICSLNICDKVRKFEMLNPISALAAKAASRALLSDHYTVKYRAANAESRQILVRGLNKLKIPHGTPCANFVAAKVPEVEGFLTRNLEHYSQMPGWQRITTHGPAVMRAYLKALEKKLNEV